MKPTICYTLPSCKNCLKCIRACPTEAITLKNNEIKIDQKKCIDCDMCIESCDSRGLKITNEHITKTMSQYDYRVILVSTSIFSDFKNFGEAKKMFKAIERLGFDEVVQYSDIEGALYMESMHQIENENSLKISSFCPTINRLIKQSYPTLVDNLLPFNYPVEVAAKKVRDRLADQHGKVGIYSLCECVGKMTLAKHPYDNEDSFIDHAMSVSHIFPKINRLKNEDEAELRISQEGIQSVVSDFYHFAQGTRPVVSISGIDNVKKVLELAEFGHMDEIGLLGLFACYKGCIGGYFLWSNPFIGRLNIDQMVGHSSHHLALLNNEDYFKEHELIDEEHISMKEKMQRFKKISEVLSTLPQFDCGACGFPNCRALAEQIVDNEADDSYCRVKRRDDHAD